MVRIIMQHVEYKKNAIKHFLLNRGEKMITSRQAVNLSVAFSETSNPNYADRIGYSTTTHGKQWVILPW